MTEAHAPTEVEPDLALIWPYTQAVEWRFAKTMAWCPHYYNFMAWNPRRAPAFKELVRVIFDHGTDQWWPEDMAGIEHANPRVVRYFHLDGCRYWVCDHDPRDVTMINRAHLDTDGKVVARPTEGV